MGHAWGYKPQVSLIAAGTSLRNYRRSGNPVIVNGTPVWSNGMMLLNSISTIALLGAEWKLASTISQFGFGGFFKIPLTGRAINGTGRGLASLFGLVATNGSSLQYGIQVPYDKTTGIPSNVYLGMNGPLSNIKAYVSSDGLVYRDAAKMSIVSSTIFKCRSGSKACWCSLGHHSPGQVP